MIRSVRAPSRISAVCQPNATMKAWPKGAKMDCPSEPAAVAIPKAQERFSGGTRRPKAAMTSVKDVVAMPTPARRPPVRYMRPGESENGIKRNARRINQRPTISTRGTPYLSAKPPAIGWKMPHIRFWRAMAKPKSLAMPLMGFGDRVGEEAHGGAGAERNDRHDAAGGDDDDRIE